MKNILLTITVFLLLPLSALAQWPTSSDTTTFRTSSDNMYLKNADSTTLKNSLLKNADSTTFRATSDASYLKNADSTTVKNTIREEISDSLDAREIKTNPHAGMIPIWVSADSLDWIYPEYTHELDTSLIVAGYLSIIESAIQRAITVDSVYHIGGGAAINVVVTILTDDTLYAADADTIANCTINTVDVGAWTSTIITANVPAGNHIWVKQSTVTTAANKEYIKPRFRYGTF